MLELVNPPLPKSNGYFQGDKEADKTHSNTPAATPFHATGFDLQTLVSFFSFSSHLSLRFLFVLFLFFFTEPR